MICFGGVCVPVNLLLPFLIGVLHRYGFFQWFKPEWVTVRYWQQRWRGTGGSSKHQSAPGVEEASTAGEKGYQTSQLQSKDDRSVKAN
ncbi:g1719 [Coccomyxa elongata]